VNFIYGANGCGKTTISNFLYNLTDNKYNSCTFSWQNETHLTLVYNKDFREKKLWKGKLGELFTLGRSIRTN
jgi:wobble nucleotide-excising tRNase